MLASMLAGLDFALFQWSLKKQFGKVTRRTAVSADAWVACCDRGLAQFRASPDFFDMNPLLSNIVWGITIEIADINLCLV